MLPLISDLFVLHKFEIHLITSSCQITYNLNKKFVQYVTFAICKGLSFICKTWYHSYRISTSKFSKKNVKIDKITQTSIIV